ncbi:MAG: DUF4388 domain-containing protein [Synechococcales cyanobacterium CRU_2_2]|nr:DUF4388 domain-containing protein [Synechococcales cyanobacterium CRU_2_2]
MALTGYLSDFSISELFKMLGQSRRTGVLTVLAVLDPDRHEPADGPAAGRAESAQAESAQAESAQTESAQTESAQTESAQAESDQTVSHSLAINASCASTRRARHLIWFYEGRVVAYVNRQGKRQFSALGDRLRQLPEPGERAIKKCRRFARNICPWDNGCKPRAYSRPPSSNRYFERS